MNNPNKSGSESDVSSESSWTVLDERPSTDSNCRLEAELKQNEEKPVKKCDFFLSTPELFPHIDDENVSDTCQIFKAKPVDDASFDDSDEERLSIHSLSTTSLSSLKNILGQDSSTTLKTKRGCAETPENIEILCSSESDLEFDSRSEPFDDFLQVKTKRNKRKSRKCKAEAWGTLSIVGTVLALTGACFLCLLSPSNVTVGTEEIQYVKEHFDDPSALNNAYSNSTTCPVILDNEGNLHVTDKSGLINQTFRKNASSPTEANKFASRKLKNLPNIEIKQIDVAKASTTVSESAPAVQSQSENVTVRDGPITYAEFLKMNRKALKTLECKTHYVDDILKSAPRKTKAYLDKRAPLTSRTKTEDTNQLVIVEEQCPSKRSLQPSKDSDHPWKELLQKAQPSQFSATPAFKEMNSSSNKTTPTKTNLGNNITSKQNTSKINSLSESIKGETKNDSNIETTNCFKQVNESVELNSNSTIINQDISKNMTDSGHVDALIKLFEDNTENSPKPEEEQDGINLNANETTIDAFPTEKNDLSGVQPTDDYMSPVLLSDLDFDLDYSDDKDAAEPEKEIDDEYTLFTPQHQTIVCHIMNDIMLLNLSTKLMRKLHAKEKKIKKQKTSRKTLRLNKMNRSATDMTHGIVEKQKSHPVPSTTTIKITFNGKKEKGSTLKLFRELPYAIEQDSGKPIKISLDGGTKIKITDLAACKTKKNAQVKASRTIVPSETKQQTKKLPKITSEQKTHKGTITTAKPAKTLKKQTETPEKIREENIRMKDYKKDIQNLRKKQDEYFEKLTKQHRERMEYLQSMRQKQQDTILSLIRQRELKTQLRKDVACGKYQVPVPSNEDVLAKLKKLREKTNSSPSFTGSNVLNESQVFVPKYLQDDCHVRSEISLQKNNASIKPTEFRSSSSRLKRKYQDTFNEELGTDSQNNIKKHNETASKYRLCTNSAHSQEYFNNKVSLIYDKVDKYLYMRQKYLEKRIKVLNTSLTALHGIMGKTPEQDSKKRESFKVMVNKVITIMRNENNLNKERKASSVESEKSFPNLLKELLAIEHEKHSATLPINNVQELDRTKSHHEALLRSSTSSSKKLALYNSLFGKRGQEIFKRDKNFWYFERYSIRNYLKNACKNDPRCNTYGRIVKKYQ